MTLVLYLGAVLLPLGVMYAIMVKSRFDVAAFVVFGHLFLFAPAPILILLGFQGRASNPFLVDINLDETIMVQALIFVLYTLGVMLGYLVFRGTRIGSGLFPRFNENRSNVMTFLGLGVLTLINVWIIAQPFVTGGGIVETVHLIRNQFYFSGANYLRIFIVVGAFLSAAHFVYLWRFRKTRGTGGLMIVSTAALFLANLLISALLGGKRFVVYPVVFFVLALLGQRLFKGGAALIMTGILFVLLVIGLQQVRVEVVHESQNLSTWDYVYTGLRFRLFEDNLVYLGTDESLHRTTTGEDFINGALGPVPRSIWSGKPDEITAGARYKRQLVPESSGGWPPYGFNQWFVNFGWLGVVIGGILTGLFIQALQAVYNDYQTNPYSFIIMMVFLVRLFVNGGIDNMFFVEYIFNVIPLFIFAMLTDKLLYSGASKASP